MQNPGECRGFFIKICCFAFLEPRIILQIELQRKREHCMDTSFDSYDLICNFNYYASLKQELVA